MYVPKLHRHASQTKKTLTVFMGQKILYLGPEHLVRNHLQLINFPFNAAIVLLNSNMDSFFIKSELTSKYLNWLLHRKYKNPFFGHVLWYSFSEFFFCCEETWINIYVEAAFQVSKRVWSDLKANLNEQKSAFANSIEPCIVETRPAPFVLTVRLNLRPG